MFSRHQIQMNPLTHMLNHLLKDPKAQLLSRKVWKLNGSLNHSSKDSIQDVWFCVLRREGKT